MAAKAENKVSTVEEESIFELYCWQECSKDPYVFDAKDIQ